MNKNLLYILFFVLLVTSCNAEKIISDRTLIDMFPEYPTIEIFKIDYLNFFADDPETEIHNTLENDGKYVVSGDFDGDGEMEFVITGLLSREPIDGKYNGFIAVISKSTEGYVPEFFKKFYKRVGDGRSIQNMALGFEEEKGLYLVFKYESGYMAFLKSSNGEYSIELAR